MLNYKHLRYFWTVANVGGLTAAAKRLNVSQSALSTQIKALEDRLGHALFERRGKSLILTEAGEVALEHADAIFTVGEELLTIMRDGAHSGRRPVRIGAAATLSRNFQLEFLKPLLGADGVRFTLRSAPVDDLMAGLEAHALDVVLTNASPLREDDARWRAEIVDRQPVSVIGHATRRDPDGDLARLLSDQPLILPGRGAPARAGFDALVEKLGVTPRVIAEIDDMAMIRLLAGSDAGVAVAPPIVMRDELRAGRLEELCALPGLEETFFAITQTRRFRNETLDLLLGAGGWNEAGDRA